MEIAVTVGAVILFAFWMGWFIRTPAERRDWIRSLYRKRRTTSPKEEQ